MKCRNCKADAERGYKYCRYHLDWYREYMAAKRRFQKKNGLCCIPFCTNKKLVFAMCEHHRLLRKKYQR